MKIIQNSKFKVQNYNLKFKILIFISLLAFYFLLLTSTVKAVESTPSGLQEFRKELNIKAASIAAKLKETISKKLQNKAYIGTIKQKSDNSITLATASNPKMVNINQDTLFESKIKGKKYSQKNLTEDDYIAALGDTDEVGVLTAKKIILLPAANSEKRKTYLWGQVISISDQLVTLKNSDSKNIAVSLPSISGIKLNSFVILTGFNNKNDVFEAEFVYKVPEGGIIKPKKIATPSAEQGSRTPSTKTASPSTKPKR